ncbi:uncharacterized protein (DUF2164 family) [Paenibacillus anaericanus]|uniref:DUF2164 domain-containing protein n=1 Tax=Paenibacillus anaericanus TaxID=170367 RepID=UPI002780DD2D|nr:DUF2164 domain-containing protein [Paenibacillus anaericanus]MDQ0088537.1 uncharacterized protein (DUF2164 family) [Paenibacillus anaericanus]
MVMSIKLPKEQKAEIINNIQAYFEEERSESIGELGADQLIDFMIQELGPHMYNKAIEDSRKLITEKMNQIDDELYTLEKPIKNWKR